MKRYINDFPDDWIINKLGDKNITKKITQGPNPQYNLGDISYDFRVLKTKDVYDHKVHYESTDMISPETFEACKSSELNDGDLIIAIVGKGSIGKSNIFIKPDNRKYIFTRALGLVRVNKEAVMPEYLDQVFKSSLGKMLFNRGINGSTGQEVIQTSYLKEIKLGFPPIPEQKKIAKILLTVDEHIDEVGGMIEDLKELKKGLMQKLLAEGIGHRSFKDSPVGRIPEVWEVKKLYDCIERVLDYRGRTPKKLGMDWGNGIIPALSANNVKMGRVDFSLPTYYGSTELFNEWMKDANLESGDVLMTMEAPLGNVAQVPDEGKYILSQRVIAFKTNKMVSNDYLRYVLMSSRFQSELDRYSTGTTAKGINQKNLRELYIVVPPIEEQSKIVNVLREVDNRIDLYNKQFISLNKIKKGLMQQLITGKKRVKVDN